MLVIDRENLKVSVFNNDVQLQNVDCFLILRLAERSGKKDKVRREVKRGIKVDKLGLSCAKLSSSLAS